MFSRFFPEGKVLMLTTPEEPLLSVKHLRYRNSNHPGILVGHYRLWNNTVTLLVQRQDRKKFKAKNRRRDYSVDDCSDQTFHLVRIHKNPMNLRVEIFFFCRNYKFSTVANLKT